ncbi:hypothetical protein COV49_04420 [Candidatus Falkowbacteria bacterium CG11_big_fil_rev_8_21_14_0_20_39_10]|uniref:Uncharacterized protein n=1 Tax=Candidatus Falkowbacteria bacterium CG11_big_fil_rev_8_21_14_0_20_39_10 TaxID=1974570 RepID=A0A2M6K7Y4_9BACT|nr:MAG: hypothetical protein COV49_04420 [Candidatus Falkowbacteria bacterium CG11_big_fil_rev_8_21_14_0_20_39_10]
MKKTIIISLIIALAFFALGYFVRDAKVYPVGQLVKGTDNFQAGWEAAKKRLADSGFVAMGNFAINNVNGQVIAVQGKAVTLKIRPLEPLADADLDERIVNVDDNTKIYILSQKDQAQYQSEMDEFNQKIREQTNNPSEPGQASVSSTRPIMSPEFFVKKEASLADIKSGAMINVVAADKDIRNTKQFSAAKIEIQPAPAVASPTVESPSTSAPVTAPATGQ